MVKLFNKAKEPWSFMTHYLGALASFVGLWLLVFKGFLIQVELKIMIGVLIFGLSLLALYSSSSIYHFFQENIYLKKLDHSMIYALIAGTYTPIALNYLPKDKGFQFTFIIWSVALLGIIIKLIWINAPRWLSTSFYVLMGWSVMFDFKSFAVMPLPCLIIVALGGISYTVGALIYAIKKPNWFKSFGFHEVFHLFVLLGSVLHFIAIYFYIL